MAKGKPWSEAELRTICIAYLELLRKEQAGLAINKSAMRRDTVAKLDGRSEGSYEMKMCNISSALRAAGLPTIKGYKGLGNAQKGLADAFNAVVADLETRFEDLPKAAG